ncbi:hypothetical protein FA13DRAFT_1788495 [Coprinellus micaceus]|uniref:Uncharacterized protein n=1 Tax=Coprinellus micaceus TaxID=71717 RepID=A0A4Y7TL17_COPMI|nr:hypothetical protein FA13DRAFT_1788495 [Coprinellus micaceus]
MPDPANSPTAFDLQTQGTYILWTSAACFTILLYNHALTFDKEVGFSAMEYTFISDLDLASRSRTSGRLAYRLQKYFFLSTVMPLKESWFQIFSRRAGCSEILTLGGWGSPSDQTRIRALCRCWSHLEWLLMGFMLSSITVQGILVLRVWALRKLTAARLKVVLVLTSACYFGGTAVRVGLLVKSFISNTESDDVATKTSFTACYTIKMADTVLGIWISTLVTECFLFLSVVVWAWLWKPREIPTSRLIKLIVHDSAIYFVVNFALLVASSFTFAYTPVFVSYLLVGPSAAACCVLGSYVFLNMRTKHHRQGDDDWQGSLSSSVLTALEDPSIIVTIALTNLNLENSTGIGGLQG